jgi:hypothetical protein
MPHAAAGAAAMLANRSERGHAHPPAVSGPGRRRELEPGHATAFAFAAVGRSLRSTTSTAILSMIGTTTSRASASTVTFMPIGIAVQGWGRAPTRPLPHLRDCASRSVRIPSGGLSVWRRERGLIPQVLFRSSASAGRSATLLLSGEGRSAAGMALRGGASVESHGKQRLNCNQFPGGS